MKQYFFNIRHICSVLAIAGLMISTSSTSFARKQKEAIKVSIINEPKVEFVEATDNTQAFKVSFDANENVKIVLTITDDRDQVLYDGAFEATSFSKTVKLVNEGYDYTPSKFYFTIRELATGNKHVFSVANDTVFLKDVVITKL
jgi:hypothetical protein